MSQIQINPKDLIPISIALIALLIFGLLVSNQWTLFSSAQTEMEEETAILESLKLKKEVVDRLKENESSLMDELNFLQYMMPMDISHAGIFDHFQSIFTDHNLRVIQLEIQDYTQQEGYGEIPIKISLTGDYGEIIRLFNDLRLGNRPFKVYDVYMNREDDGTSNIYCDLLVHGFFKIAGK